MSGPARLMKGFLTEGCSVAFRELVCLLDCVGISILIVIALTAALFDGKLDLLLEQLLGFEGALDINHYHYEICSHQEVAAHLSTTLSSTGLIS